MSSGVYASQTASRAATVEASAGSSTSAPDPAATTIGVSAGSSEPPHPDAIAAVAQSASEPITIALRAPAAVTRASLCVRPHSGLGLGNWLRITASQARSLSSARWPSASRADAVTL